MGSVVAFASGQPQAYFFYLYGAWTSLAFAVLFLRVMYFYGTLLSSFSKVRFS